MNKHFRHIISLILIGIISILSQYAAAQSNNRNYVCEWEAIEPSTEAPPPYSDLSKMTVTYFDGMGRKISTVKAGASEGVFDIADFTTYDNVGRVKKEYLPIELPDVSGNYPTNFISNATTFHNDSRPYTEHIYDNATNNRIVESRLPGVKWHNDNKHARSSYLINDDYGELACVRFDVDDDGSLFNSDNYTPGALRVTITLDEDSNKVATFTDKAGRKLLMRQFLETQTVDTYWVYDRYNRLRYMISPEGANLLSASIGECDDETIALYCYYYDYDSRNRCIMKRLPGVEPVYFVYDKLNRVIFSQDGAQRSNNEWSVTKYDNRHRVAIEGVVTIAGATRESLQNQWGDTLLFESHDPSIMTESLMQYTSNFNIPGFEPHKAYYYDDYSHWSAIAPFPQDAAFESATSVSANGLLTGTAVTDFMGNYYITLSVYDRKGNVVLSAERDIYGQDYQVADFYKYNFSGIPTNRKRVTSFLVEQTVTESHQEEWNYYSGIWGQLYQTMHRYGSGNWVRLSNNSYDIDGKVVRRTRGIYNNQGLKTDYQYNIRGWLTSQSSPLFSQNLFYTEPVDSTPNMVLLSVPKYYNGNIAGLNESRWTPQGVITGYRAVSYDNIGRIKNVYDSEPNRFNEWYSYDLNGNITSIRRGESLNTLYDDISISYVGNRMDRVVDNSETDEFLGKIPQLGATGHLLLTDTIGYDASGRLTSDYSRGITQVVYNPLDLPSTVRMGAKDRINYTYRSDGVKMREQSTHQYTKLVMKISASGDTTYVQRNASDTHFRARYGNYVKETGQPDKIYNEEGYIALHGDSVSYHFFERDYLGSVRAVFDLYGNLEQTNDYNVTGIPSSRHLGNADVHKHTGKEFQGFNGLAWYDNNARYYDPILGRFTTQDPLAEKYPWLSPYNHCANNPLKFVDRDGMRINFAKLQKYDLHTGTNMVDQIIGDLSIQTGLSLSIDDDGYLNYSSNSNGVPIVTSIGNQLTGSVTARSHLLKLIDSSDCLIIKPGARSKADPNAINEIGLSSKQIQQFIDGATNVDSKTLGFGMTFLHESFHTEMGGNLSDDFIGTGEVVDIMNQIRKELNQIGYNYGKRTNYTGINVNGSIYIPMDKSSLNKLNLELTPDKDDQYIIFYP